MVNSKLCQHWNVSQVECCVNGVLFFKLVLFLQFILIQINKKQDCNVIVIPFQEEERRIQEQQHAVMLAERSRTPSESSYNSGLLPVPAVGGDKISIHSEFGFEKERRLSIINSRGNKVSKKVKVL